MAAGRCVFLYSSPFPPVPLLLLLLLLLLLRILARLVSSSSYRRFASDRWVGWIRYRTRVPLILSFFFISTEFSSSNGSSELIWFVCSFSCRCFLRRVLPSFFEIRNQGKTKKKRKKFQKKQKQKKTEYRVVQQHLFFSIGYVKRREIVWIFSTAFRVAGRHRKKRAAPAQLRIVTY